MQTLDQLRRWLDGYSSSASPKLPQSVSSLPPALPTPPAPRLEGKSLMAKIADAVRPSTAQRIAKEERAIADVERQIVDMQAAQKLRSLDEEADEAVKIAEKISFAERRLIVHRERLKALHKQQRREAVDQLQRQKDAELQDFEKKLTGKATAGVRLDRAIVEFAAAMQAYNEACRAPFASWPATFPSIKIFEGFSHSHMDSRIASALRMRSVAPELFANLSTRIGSIAERDIKIAASLVEDIRTAPLPKLHDDPEGMAA